MCCVIVRNKLAHIRRAIKDADENIYIHRPSSNTE